MYKRCFIILIVMVLSTIPGYAQMGNGGGGGGGGGGGHNGGGGGGTTTGTSLTTFTTDDFSGSGNCAMCHSGIIDSIGQDVSMDKQWRSTMMANSSKDPLWQAKISSEVQRNPALSDAIQEKCSRCHTPMARVQAGVDGTDIQVLNDGFLNSSNYLHDAAMDGVSCSICHQINQIGLGTAESFTGNYHIDTSTTSPYRWIYGSFAQPFQNPMQMHVGYTPVQGSHINESSYCAACHTLYTPIVDASGSIIGEFPEQTPYLEWENSSFSTSGQETSCQACHTPDGSGSSVLSNRPNWLSQRSPVGQHIFVGGNVFMLNILNTNSSVLGITAETTQLDTTTNLTSAQLGNFTGEVSILNQNIQNSTLTLDVQVSNMAGHKFPTGVPTRRAWLHVKITDKRGRMIFESGAPWSDGRIVGNDADDFAGKYEQHYEVITSPDQVQIYEAIMQNTSGELTYTFLNAADYLKDNRVLPDGFDKIGAHDDIAVHGKATLDQDFIGGSDKVTYVIDVSKARLPLQVSVSLLYQSVGRRFMEDLRLSNTTEVQSFIGYYDNAEKLPVQIDSKQISIK